MKWFKVTAFVLLSTGALAMSARARTGSELRKLQLLPGVNSDNFGFAMDIDGDTAVIGAPGFNGTGQAVVDAKIHSGWTGGQAPTPPGTPDYDAVIVVAIAEAS